VAAVVPGDVVVVREGDIVPVDGIVLASSAVLDESALTGEARPVVHAEGEPVRSGTANAGASFELRATTTAADSAYAGIVRMVGQAQAARAPLVRLADDYARAFVPLTLAAAGLAWALSGTAERALAVLVVATPCPLLLAAPVAIISGVSRAARRGIVVKGGAALETLARSTALYLDKTGTITTGAPRLQRIATCEPDLTATALLRLAASLDQMSSHVLASALVRAARERGVALAVPRHVAEKPGAGIEGQVDGVPVQLGTFAWVARGDAPTAAAHAFRRRILRDEGSVAFVAVDGRLAGALVFDDAIRPDAPRMLRRLRRLGIQEAVMLTGDHVAVADSVGAAIGVDRVMADLGPEEKVDAVRRARQGRVTLMVGDGLNDAPALAAADVGVAMGARGATSSSEAADIVLVVDRLDRLVEALEIAQRARSIAVQSMVAGMALSGLAMVAAGLGLLTPVAGAVLQEAIDTATIANALRALGGRRGRPAPRLSADVAASLHGEHRKLAPCVDELRELADHLDQLAPADLDLRLREARRALATILAHERADETDVYRTLAATLGSDDPLAPMSRTHQEIFHLVRVFERLMDDLPADGPAPEDRLDLRRTLYALHTVLRLHFAQEEELYLSLDRDATVTATG
jgi:heavy metal translocating P-type ATPase